MKNLIILTISIIRILIAQPMPGYTLFSPMPGQGQQINTHSTYLINNDLEIENQWVQDCRVASIAYLQPDSTLIMPCNQNVSGMQGGPAGGRIKKLTWDNQVIYDFIYANENMQPHHDIEPMPNGNILSVAFERKTNQEALDAGRENINGEIWPEIVLELQPMGSDSFIVVWEWHLWDHIIQDVDINKPNFGVISEHPELLNVNLGNIGGGGNNSGDWVHANAIHFNPQLNQIIISCRKLNEFLVIDHSTTTEQAMGHSGGFHGKGGDIIYRWGNPENYGRGSTENQQLQSQHSVNWIKPGYPGAGNIILYNNGSIQTGSTIKELIPPLENGLYFLAEGEAYGPIAPIWEYGGDNTFFSDVQSGAFRLLNGNTFITVAASQLMFEVSTENEIVWEYQYNGEELGNIARAQKYHPNYFNTQPPYQLGDVNMDNSVNVIDIVSMVNHILDFIQLENQSFNLGDVNNDGEINVVDIIQVVNFILENE